MHSPVRLLKISGDDAQAFLQGQLTSDVSKLSDTWQLTGYCNPKGRLLCTGFLWRTDEHFFLLLHAQLFEAVQARLKMYVMRSKVILEECANKVYVYEYAHEDANSSQAPPPNVSASAVEQAFGRYSSDSKLHTLYCANHAIEIEVLDNVSAGNTQIGLSMQDLCVREGLVLISPALSEKYVPQMVNLELVGGVSFKKGCYTGQEIVARMHYLGKPKQRLYRYSITDVGDGPGIPIATDSKLILSANANDDQPDIPVGELISLNQATSYALIVARVAHAGQELRLADNPSIILTPTTLPYPMG